MSASGARKKPRKAVPCECKGCGGIKLVGQEERRRHLFAQATSSTSPSAPPTRVFVAAPPSTHHDIVPSALPMAPTSSTHTDMLASTAQSFETSGPTISSMEYDFSPPPFQTEDSPYPVDEPDIGNTSDIHSSPSDEEDIGDSLSPPIPVIPPTSPHPPPVPNLPSTTPLTSAPSIPPVAIGVPEHKTRENTPDPFKAQTDSTTASSPVGNLADAHSDHGISLLYMLVTWLHLQFHVPLRACSTIVGVVVLILQSFGVLTASPPVTTLSTILKKLRVEPDIRVFPICPQCFEVYPDSADVDAICEKCHSFVFKTSNSATTTAGPRVPLLRFPYKSIESQLASILAIPGMEGEMEQWRKKNRLPNVYTDIFDGAVAQDLPAPDGTKFFRNEPGDANGPNGELRIGLTLGLDWFSYLRSQIAPSHTSGPISFNVANLSDYLKYRTANLILCGIFPGPKEHNPDECHRFLRILVNELLRLWQDGVRIPTPSCPLGRLIRVILLCVCCDKPAAHKVGGFGSHSHTFFCTRCWISQSEKASSKSFTSKGFRARTNLEHRRSGEKYALLTSAHAREEFAKKNAVRWTEFSRLPYFDAVRMIVIDPMHNLLLGLVKTHFYHIWVQNKILRKSKELAMLHTVLAQVEMPAYLGRLPTLVGIPAGGSLTADQWLLMATVVGPMVIPQIWAEFMGPPDDARLQRSKLIQARASKKIKEKQRKEAAKAAAKAQTSQAKANNHSVALAPITVPNTTNPTQAPRRRKRQHKPSGSGDESDDDDNQTPCLHPDDPANFLKLCFALRTLVRHQLTSTEVDEAQESLRAYCSELVTLYGEDVIRPNHHYAMHISECIHDFGPMHGFWTFLFERLNKVLKSYKTNNHGGGELEVTFFREFHRTVSTSRLVGQASASGQPVYFQDAATLMFSASADDRGTLQSLAKEDLESHEDDDVMFSLSPRFEVKHLPHMTYSAIVSYLQAMFPLLHLRSYLEHGSLNNTIPLTPLARFFDYAVIRRHRFHALHRARSTANSLVEVQVAENGTMWSGELLDVIQLNQGVDNKISFTLGHFRWFRPAVANLDGTVWPAFLPLNVKLWYRGSYLSLNEPGPPAYLPLHYISSHIARSVVEIAGISTWVTLAVRKVLSNIRQVFDIF